MNSLTDNPPQQDPRTLGTLIDDAILLEKGQCELRRSLVIRERHGVGHKNPAPQVQNRRMPGAGVFVQNLFQEQFGIFRSEGPRFFKFFRRFWACLRRLDD